MNRPDLAANPAPTLDYSIIIPVYFNEGELWNTFNQINEKVVAHNAAKGRTGEIIFVDDGSRDGSWSELKAIQESAPGLVRLFRFTRNFGHYWSRIAGHKLAKGRQLLCISADLQDPPELMNEMLDEAIDNGFHIVIGERAGRDESAYRKFTSSLYYGLIRKMTFPTMPAGGFDFFLMSATVKDLLFANPERNSYFQGQLFWTGYPIKSIPYHRMARQSENISRWTFAKKLKQTIDVVLGFSYAPVRAATVIGGSVAGLGFLYAVWVFFRGLLGLTPNGFAPLMVTILILGGLQLMMIGIVGEYVWRTLDEARGRPKYIIAESVEG